MSGSRPWAAVLGSPVAHSLSPVLHRAAYAQLGLDWDYVAIDCAESALPGLLAQVRRDAGWRGLSLTMPLKLTAVGLVDRLTPQAMAVGAVNTVLPVDRALPGDPVLSGDNTDLPALQACLVTLGVPAPRRPVLLGAGGTARAAVGALAGLGARAGIVVARDVTRAGPLVELAARLGVLVRPVEWTAAPRYLGEADVVVSTTPRGATDGLAGTGWPAGVPLLEVVYDPWPTALAAAALKAGAPVLGGMALLVEQAGGQVRLMTGWEPPIHAMRAAGEQALAARSGLHGG